MAIEFKVSVGHALADDVVIGLRCGIEIGIPVWLRIEIVTGSLDLMIVVAAFSLRI